MGWLTEIVIGFIADVAEEFLNAFAGIINNGYAITLFLSETKTVSTAVAFTKLLACVLLTAVAIKQVIEIYGLHTAGDSNEDAVEVLYRTSLSTMLISTVDFVYKQLLTFSVRLIKDVQSISKSKISDELDNMLDSQIFICVSVLLAVVMIVMLIVSLVISAIRGAQLTLMRVLYPIFCINKASSNPDKFNKFMWKYVTSFVSYAIQIFCFGQFVYFLQQSYLQVDNGNPILSLNCLLAIAWLYMVIKSPDWLDEFTFKSGVGSSLGRTVQSAGQILLMRM